MDRVLSWVKNHKYVVCLFSFFVFFLFVFVIYPTYSEKTSSSIWDGTIADSFASGIGDVNDPYVISDGSEFAYFLQLLNDNDNSEYFNKNYMLSNNIDFNNIEFNINFNKSVFSGVIDGAGYTLSNININKYLIEDDVKKYSLFYKLENAEIKNINIVDTTLNLNLNNSEISVISNNIENSKINNIMINHVTLNNNIMVSDDEQENFKASLISIYDNNNDYKNIFINSLVDSNNYYDLAYSFNNSSLSNIINNEEISLINDSISFENIYKFHIDNDEIIINGDKTLKNIFKEFNDESDYTWTCLDNNIRLINKGKNNLLFKIARASVSFQTHDSGVEGNIVYVNDLDHDYDYYMGLNYTEISSSSLPTEYATHKYREDTLVPVRLIYSSCDINNSELCGTVSSSDVASNENQDTFIYYKYYYIDNGYINIELIDNPFTGRPTGKGFNGWVTNYDGAVLSYDSEYYKRYLKIPASSGMNITINLYASWVDANVIIGNASSITNFDAVGMKDVPKKYTEQVSYGYVDKFTNNYTNYYERVVLKRNESFTRPVGTYMYYGTVNSTTNVVVNNLTRTTDNTYNCTGTSNNRRCYVYYQTSDNDPDSSKTYFTLTRNTSGTYNATQATRANNGLTQEYGQIITMVEDGIYLNNGESASGLYYKKNVGTDSRGLYYNANGQNCLDVTCSNGNTYKLLQSNDNEALYHENYTSSNYYYLVTRDMNILYFNGDPTVISDFVSTKPYTLTSDGAVKTLNYASLTITADMTIENVKLQSVRGTGIFASNSTPGTLYGNNFNLKVGRNVSSLNSSSYTFDSVIGGSSNNNETIKKNTLIVESGYYNESEASRVSSSNYKSAVYAIYGSDYDRVKNDNSKLRIYYRLYNGTENYQESENALTPYSTVVMKSGSVGVNSSGTINSDVGASIYMLSNYGSRSRAYSKLIIYGGFIKTVQGGAGYYVNTNTNTDNGVAIYMIDGTVGTIFGGARKNASYGNRIISATGGEVLFNIFGASNAYDEGDGVLNGETLIYVGGTVNVGTSSTDYSSDDRFDVSIGNVFGAGAGRSGQSAGRATKSTIIINGGTIKDSVYGGGNYGIILGTSTSSSNIIVKDGVIGGSVYGGGNMGGAGSSSYTTNCNISMTGGTINNSIFGGSKTSGIVYGATDINITGGEIKKDVYGGGEGGYESSSSQGTFVRDNVNIVIGNSDEGPTVTGAIYGGSAYGTVNAVTYDASSNTKKVDVTINNGNIGAVYGGAKGNDDITPYIKGNITVDINGGSIGAVYGGFDANGKPEADDVVYIDGGVIGSAFGGGNNTSIDETKIYMRDGVVTNLYGGSNNSGTVNQTNVYISGGTTSNAFGGNNAGGECLDTYIEMTNGKVLNNLYGGGNLVSTSETNVKIVNGTINSVFGGGNKAGVSTESNVLINGGNILNTFGGSNQAGDVKVSNVLLDANTSVPDDTSNGVSFDVNTEFSPIEQWQQSQFGYQYNGIVTIHVKVNNNSSENISSWNGSISAPNTSLYYNYSSDTLVTDNNGIYSFNSDSRWTNGDVHSLAPGKSYEFDFTILSNKEDYLLYHYNLDAFDSNNTLHTVTNDGFKIYGGNNFGGVTKEANVEIKNGYVFEVYGGGNEATVETPYVKVTGGAIRNLYGGGNDAEIINDTTLDITGGIIYENVYGGGNLGVVDKNTNVSIKDGNINGSVYAGGNGSKAIVKLNTNVNVSGNTVIGTSTCEKKPNCSLFGGGNAAETGITGNNSSIATVNVAGGTIYGNVYGGANTSVVNGSTYVNVGNAALSNNVVKSPITIYGTVFGGGEANASGSENYDWRFISVTSLIEINVDGTDFNDIDIKGSVFGSGNASTSSGESTINFTNYGSYSSPKRIISLQRTTNLNIDNSALILYGAKDRTNQFADTLFTLSIIKKLNLMNNSTLFLENGTNLLEEFNSYKQMGTYAVVDINEDTGVVTKNVDNRLYVLQGVSQVNIAKGETIDDTATDFGAVKGMTFFGLYSYNSSGEANPGIYKKTINNGDPLNWGDMPIRGSFVIGLHAANQDIEKDGFYSNFMDEETETNKVNYIDPTPKDTDFYRWIIGELITEYNVELSASKYSTLGIKEISFIDFADPNTNFEILGFDYSGLAPGVSLVSRENVPRIASSSDVADNVMSLKMETGNSGWLNNGETYFLSNEPSVLGSKKYVGENSNVVRSLSFYLYHSKNLGTTDDMGVVSIVIMAIRRIDGITSEAKRIVINVKLSRVLYNTNEYEGVIAPGRKYSIFPSSIVDITNKSSMSAYFSLYNNGNTIYHNGDYRVLLSRTVIPSGTKITMIDLSLFDPKYYYYNITDADVVDAENQLSTQGEVMYPLSKFEVMGAINSGVHYNDSVNNNLYFHGGTNSYTSEEFIFIFDFEDANITSDLLDNNITIGINNASGGTLISILDNRNMSFDIYYDKDAEIDMNGTISKSTIYTGENFGVDLTSDYTQSKSGSTVINDTKIIDYKQGIKIYFMNQNNEIVSGTSLMGLYYTIDNVNYYPTLDGTARIKIADKVGNAMTWLTVHTENSNVPSGDYTLVVETFASPDGIYYGLTSSDRVEFPITIINEKYGLNILIDNTELVIDKTTGYNLNNNKSLEFNIRYNSIFTNSSLNMKLYRRLYNDVYDTNYELVDLQDYLDMSLIQMNNNPREYIITRNPYDNMKLTLDLKDNLLNGTYKLEFILYDNGSKIGTVEKYLIIK